MPDAIPTSGMSMQDSMPGLGPSLLGAATTPRGSGDDVMDQLIKTITTPIDPSLVRAATTPIPSQRATQVPSSLMRPVEAPTPGQAIPNPMAGRGSANGVGIGNAVIGAMNILGKVSQHEQQAKQDQLRDAATKVINAQAAVDEATRQRDAAKQAGDTEGMAAAQKTIDQNEAVRDGVFADPKLRKGLQKGFDISYTDPSSNKTDEHSAVLAAIQQAKTMQEKKQALQAYKQQQNQQQGKAMGAAYAQQQPQTFQPNVQAQAKLQYEMANRTASQAAFKDYLTFKASMARANATIGAAQIRQMGAGMLEQARIQARQDAADVAWQRTQERLGIQYRNSLGLIGARLKSAKDLVDYREQDPIKLAEAMRKQIDAYDKTGREIEGQLNSLDAQRLAMYSDKGKTLTPNPQDVSKLDATIQYMKQSQQNAAANKAAVLKNYNTLRAAYGLDGEGGPDAGSNSSNDDAGGDNFDPINYMGNSTDEDEQP